MDSATERCISKTHPEKLVGAKARGYELKFYAGVRPIERITKVAVFDAKQLINRLIGGPVDTQ